MYAHQKLRRNRIEYCNIWCSSCFIGTDVFARKCLLFFHLTQAKIKNGFLCTPTDPTKLPLPNTFFNCLILIFTKIDCPCHIINTLSFCINKYWISLTFYYRKQKYSLIIYIEKAFLKYNPKRHTASRDLLQQKR